MNDIRLGSYVTHPQRPEWGVGKIFCLCAHHALVGFQKLPAQDRFKRLERTTARLEVADTKQDAVLDSWSVDSDSTCREVAVIGRARKSVRVKAPRLPLIAEWTRAQALERFHAIYKGGFQDPQYAPKERDWKWVKHDLWEETVAAEGFRALATRSPEEAAKLIETMIQTKSPLLHPRGELVALRDAIHSPESAAAYFSTLADLLEAPSLTAEVFDKHYQALTSLPLVRAKSVAKWTILTVIPFLVQPTRHMFLKPGRIKEITRLLGVDILYSPTPKWDTYERLLAFSHELLEFLKPHGAQDLIDVQSFIFAITEPDDSAAAA